MKKTVRIQPATAQDPSRKRELLQRTPSERMRMLFVLMDRAAQRPRLERVATIRHVPFWRHEGLASSFQPEEGPLRDLRRIRRCETRLCAYDARSGPADTSLEELENQ